MATTAPKVKRPTNTIELSPIGEPLTEGEAFFCTDAKHPSPAGSPIPLLDMFDLARVFFGAPGAGGCPVCPACKKQTSSIPLDDPEQLPPSLQALKTRLEASQHV